MMMSSVHVADRKMEGYAGYRKHSSCRGDMITAMVMGCMSGHSTGAHRRTAFLVPTFGYPYYEYHYMFSHFQNRATRYVVTHVLEYEYLGSLHSVQNRICRQVSIREIRCSADSSMETHSQGREFVIATKTVLSSIKHRHG